MRSKKNNILGCGSHFKLLSTKNMNASHGIEETVFSVEQSATKNSHFSSRNLQKIQKSILASLAKFQRKKHTVENIQKFRPSGNITFFSPALQ